MTILKIWLLFCAHMDTVNPGCGIKPVLESGVFKSDGKTTILGADNKAPMTAIMIGVEDYLKQTENPRPIELLFTVKEETGGGVELFDAKRIVSKHGIIFDMVKPIGGITIASPHIINFVIEFKGKSAHASTPEKGISVLEPVAKFLQSVRIGKLDDDQTTINVGLVNAGTVVNAVPGQAVISGEVRSFDKVLFDKHLDAIEQQARNVIVGNAVKIEFSTDGYCPGYSYTPDDVWVNFVSDIYKENDVVTSCEKVSGVSDANSLNAAGVKVLTLGDGVEDAHTPEESVSLDSIKKMRQLVVAFLEKYQP